MDLHSVSKLLGHAQLSTTSRYLRMARPGYSAGGDALALLSQLPKTPPPPSPPSPGTELASAVSATLAEVLRSFGPAYLRQHALSTAQARAWRAIVACRTPALGGQGAALRPVWARAAAVPFLPQPALPAVPERRRATPGARPGWPSCCRCRTATWCSRCRMPSTAWRSAMRAGSTARLMQCAAATLTEFAANPRWLGAIARLHPGAAHLDAGPAPAHPCARADGLRRRCDEPGPVVRAQAQPDLPVPGARPVQGASGQVPGRAAARRPGRHVAARSGQHRGCASGAARAAHAPRLGGLRQDAAGRAGGGAGLSVALHAPRGHLQRAHRRHRRPGRAPARSRRRPRRQAHDRDRRAATFIARFLQHVLPPGFKRIRHYGLLSPALKAQKLAAARAALAMPAANEQAREALEPARSRTAPRTSSIWAAAQHSTLSVLRIRLRGCTSAESRRDGSAMSSNGRDQAKCVKCCRSTSPADGREQTARVRVL